MTGPLAHAWAANKRLRAQITDFIDRRQQAWNAGMMILAVIYLTASVVNYRDPVAMPAWVIVLFSIVFFAEFAVRLWAAPSRWIYFRGHWLDLLSSIPAIGILRGIRILRPLAIGVRLIADTRRTRGAESFWFIWGSALLLWVGASYTLWILEHDAPHTTVRTFGDALWWGIITITTVGYGDTYPVTGDGRILGGFVAFVGLGLIGVVSSQFTNWLLKPGKKEEAAEEERRGEIAALRTEIAELRTLLEQRLPASTAGDAEA